MSRLMSYFARALFCSLLAINATSAYGVAINLGVGQQEVLTFESLARSVNVSRSGVVEVSKGDTKSVVVLVGKSEGMTEVTVNLQDGKSISYDVTVSKSARSTFSALLSKLRNSPGISVDEQNGKYIVAGQFRTRSGQLALKNGMREFPGMLVDTTDPDIVESSSVVKAINRVLADNDISNLQAHAYGQIIALEGSAKNDTQRALALRIARTISPGVEDHVSTDSSGAPPIAIEVLFIEAAKTNNKTYGIRGPQGAFAGRPDAESGVVGASATGFNAGRQLGKHQLNWQVGNLTAFLRLEQEKGSSRVVSNPKLIARSGQKALFESGGAFYIPQEERTADGKILRSFVQQQTGITLTIEPKIDMIGQIDSVIKTTIVEVAEKSGTDAPPNLLKSNLETSITIPSGQSILLSGLTLKKARKTVSRVPFLADIPLIGELFKQRTQGFEEKEVAVIVTMKRVAPAENRAQVADQLLETSDNDVSFSFFD